MKKKFIKALSVIVATVTAGCALTLTGCKKGDPVEIGRADILDADVPPTVTAPYEQEYKQALAEFKAVADMHRNEDGDPDFENSVEVQEAAKVAAAKIYAYACYNERELDQYVWFTDKMGGTSLSAGSADVIKQDYYLRINENDEHCGYRYFFTYKYVTKATGLVGGFKGAFEDARLRITVDTDDTYRFQGDDMRIGWKSDALCCDHMIVADWKTKDDEWGVWDHSMVKQQHIEPEDIEADIIKQADDYYNGRLDNSMDNPNIHGNINILAEDIVKSAIISIDDDGGCFISMTIDTDVANEDRPSVQMLSKENGTKGDCHWKGNPDDEDDTGMIISFHLWHNGLFSFYGIQERWKGKIDAAGMGISGEANSEIVAYYSYSDRDCDMAAALAILDSAKAAKGQ